MQCCVSVQGAQHQSQTYSCSYMHSTELSLQYVGCLLCMRALYSSRSSPRRAFSTSGVLAEPARAQEAASRRARFSPSFTPAMVDTRVNVGTCINLGYKSSPSPCIYVFSIAVHHGCTWCRPAFEQMGLPSSDQAQGQCSLPWVHPSHVAIRGSMQVGGAGDGCGHLTSA
jgi:hypothetical protein